MTVLHLHTCTTRKQKTKTCSSLFIIITKNKLKPKKEREKESKSSHWVLLLHCFAFALKNKETSTVQNRTFHNISNPKPIFHWAGTFFLSWLCSVQCVPLFGCLYNYKSLGKESKRSSFFLFFFLFFFSFLVSWEPNRWLWSSF